MAEHAGVCAGVDVGGTFTDVVVHAAGHRPRAVKVPTTPDNQAVGVERGVAQSWPHAPLRLLPHGTTTATNAVLERKIARTVLVTTNGFADVLQIGRQRSGTGFHADDQSLRELVTGKSRTIVRRWCTPGRVIC